MNEFYCFENEEERNHYLGDKISCEEQYLCELEKFIKSGYRLIEYSRDKIKKYDEVEEMIDRLFDAHQGLEHYRNLDKYVKQIHDKVNVLNVP